MDAVFQKMSERDFEKLEATIVFQDPLTNRSFGALSNRNLIFSFGWNSDLIEPEIKEVSPNIYSIGIDMNFAIVDFNNGAVVTYLQLYYFFYLTIPTESELLVVTEMEIFKLDKKNFQIITTYGLPDFFESMKIFPDRYEVKCLNGGHHVIRL